MSRYQKIGIVIYSLSVFVYLVTLLFWAAHPYSVSIAELWSLSDDREITFENSLKVFWAFDNLQTIFSGGDRWIGSASLQMMVTIAILWLAILLAVVSLAECENASDWFLRILPFLLIPAASWCSPYIVASILWFVGLVIAVLGFCASFLDGLWQTPVLSTILVVCVLIVAFCVGFPLFLANLMLILCYAAGFWILSAAGWDLQFTFQMAITLTWFLAIFSAAFARG